MTEKINVGIVGTGLYIPKTVMTADDISKATKGVWTERAVIELSLIHIFTQDSNCCS